MLQSSSFLSLLFQTEVKVMNFSEFIFHARTQVSFGFILVKVVMPNKSWEK